MHTTLRRLEDLFAHRGDAHVLLALAGSHPLRFSELARLMYRRSTVRIADTTILRILDRLQAEGSVQADHEDPRHPRYGLTPSGEDDAEVITMLVRALDDYGVRSSDEPRVIDLRTGGGDPGRLRASTRSSR